MKKLEKKTIEIICSRCQEFCGLSYYELQDTKSGGFVVLCEKCGAQFNFWLGRK